MNRNNIYKIAFWVLLIGVVVTIVNINIKRAIIKDKRITITLDKFTHLPLLGDTVKPSSLVTKQIFILIDFVDFGCESCKQQATDICSQINDMHIYNKALIIIKGQKNNLSYYNYLMKEWQSAIGNNIAFCVANSSFFIENGINKSSIIIYDGKKLIFHKEFPLSKSSFQKLKYIVKKQEISFLN